MTSIKFYPTACAICGQGIASQELYPARLQDDSLSPNKFSARRTPDRTHFRIVKCEACGLFRSDPIADSESLAALYKQSSFDYDSEVLNIRKTYGSCLRKLEAIGVKKDSLLEVGCGNGFFLEEAQKQGYRDVQGVEPSASAREKATCNVREKIVPDIFRPGIFPESRFDVICFFQVFDHLPDPAGVLFESFRILRPGGLVLCLNHNINAVSAQILKEKSPIIDIEHTFLYSTKTLSRLFEKSGLKIIRKGTVFNFYSLAYLVRLCPIPGSLKNLILSGLGAFNLNSFRILAPLGNLFVIGKKILDNSISPKS